MGTNIYICSEIKIDGKWICVDDLADRTIHNYKRDGFSQYHNYELFTVLANVRRRDFRFPQYTSINHYMKIEDLWNRPELKDNPISEKTLKAINFDSDYCHQTNFPFYTLKELIDFHNKSIYDNKITTYGYFAEWLRELIAYFSNIRSNEIISPEDYRIVFNFD